MPTTFSNIVPIRRVAVGDCSGPMGSGFDALARSAYAALLRADWTQSAEPPFLPVHDNGQTANKTIPHGDAWKCSYGYDADARTERSACGAVCYTFALPSDATAGTPANISTVALSLTGDRYLDAGVDLYLIPSASPTPPAIPDLLALVPVGTYCATSDQSPTPPNERHGVTETVSATLGVAAQSYLHVALLLHDYTTNRGAWIEGGALLDSSAATVVFSREVVQTPVETDADWGDANTHDDRCNRSPTIIAPHIVYGYEFSVTDTASIGSIQYPTEDLRQREGFLAMISPTVDAIRTNPGLGMSITTSASNDRGTIRLTKTGSSTVIVKPQISVALRSGFFHDGEYTGISVADSGATNLQLPVRVVAYVFTRPQFVVLPGYESICSQSFWSASDETVKCITNRNYYVNTTFFEFPVPENPDVVIETTDVAAVPLFTSLVPEGGSLDGTYQFPVPLTLRGASYPLGYPATIILGFRAAPGSTVEGASATISDNIEVSLIANG